MQLGELLLEDIGPFDQLRLALPEGRRADRADVHLLVGPNGTGKSTILEAVAQLFTPARTGFVGRTRSPSSRARATDRAGETFEWAPTTGQHVGSNRGLVFHLQPLTGAELFARSPVFRNDHALVFAYGAQRRATGALVPGVAALVDNPLTEAALFDKPSSDGAFSQWMVNLVAQRAIAEEEGDHARATRFTLTLLGVKWALEQVTGSSVVFRTRSDLLGVNVVLDGREVPQSQLPAGLSALLSWVGDLLMRLDRLPWADDLPVHQREFVLLLDEVEVHLHPTWQRRVLPMVEQLFPKAQILAATHSPFVIQSASDAYVHRFELVDGRSVLAESVHAPVGSSYQAVLQSLMGIDTDFSLPITDRWERLRAHKLGVLAGTYDRAAFDAEARELADLSEELYQLVAVEVRQLERQLKSARG